MQPVQEKGHEQRWQTEHNAMLHDAKNQLMLIMLQAEQLAGQGGEAGRIAKAMTASAQLCSSILSRSGSCLDYVDINLLAEETAEIVSAGFPHIKVGLRTDAQEELIFSDWWALQSAVINLAVNSAQAQQDRGEITIFTFNRRAADGVTAAIGVSDRGPGIPEQLIKAVFEPGITTKTGGSGLGLYRVKKTVKELGGELLVESSPLGTRICALFDAICCT